ncbi:hypothetical protein AAFF_G00259800 [Aldrovandia affinis]|uniref:Uncharacterized protein n=1 Tax=Aldrovandia affinis TaxID=143900 RepID=A0AAD7RC13_9TELE|nr:hypothetical protein AAFF_G00259800 [Aldrovandia affinis]
MQWELLIAPRKPRRKEHWAPSCLMRRKRLPQSSMRSSTGGSTRRVRCRGGLRGAGASGVSDAFPHCQNAPEKVFERLSLSALGLRGPGTGKADSRRITAPEHPSHGSSIISAICGAGGESTVGL